VTWLVAMLLVLLVAGLIAAPLLRAGPAADGQARGAAADELWHREKAVALLAISEAEFDRATGKLSDDDYQVLRDDYEGRALRAMGELEVRMEAAPGPAPATAQRFCSRCGRAFAAADRFCAGCGCARG